MHVEDMSTQTGGFPLTNQNSCVEDIHIVYADVPLPLANQNSPILIRPEGI